MNVSSFWRAYIHEYKHYDDLIFMNVSLILKVVHELTFMNISVILMNVRPYIHECKHYADDVNVRFMNVTWWYPEPHCSSVDPGVQRRFVACALLANDAHTILTYLGLTPATERWDSRQSEVQYPHHPPAQR